MAEFIARVRLLIHDPGGERERYTDEQVREALAARTDTEGEADVYAAAADLLEAWAAKEKLAFDFDADGQSFKRSQKMRALLELAREYRRQQRPQQGVLVRSDAV